MRCGVHDDLVLPLGNALRVNPDHTVVNAPFLHHQRAHLRVTLETSGIGDLEAALGDDIAAQETRDRHPDGADVRLDMRFRSYEKVAVTLDLPAEVT